MNPKRLLFLELEILRFFRKFRRGSMFPAVLIRMNMFRIRPMPNDEEVQAAIADMCWHKARW
jgi:hypothetical protein